MPRDIKEKERAQTRRRGANGGRQPKGRDELKRDRKKTTLEIRGEEAKRDRSGKIYDHCQQRATRRGKRKKSGKKKGNRTKVILRRW